MKKRRPTSRIWLIALLFAVVVPLLGATVGVAITVEALSLVSVSWILFCSAIPMLFAGGVNSIVIGIGYRFNKTNTYLIGVFIFISIVIFTLSVRIAEFLSVI
ncbi:MAG: hypothetical protein ACSHX6_11275 [Akkermansiaceae bacterium]